MAGALTILCVDDERMVLVALREQLQRHLGDAVLLEAADDAESALEILDELLAEGQLVPLVITDHIMPGMKGDALVARVHERSPSTRNVMLTGQATADAVGNALNTGGLYRFLAKPWNVDDLLLTVREALASFAHEREASLSREALRAAHAAALSLSESLASSDRYVRLLDRLRPLVGADEAALLRRRKGRWVELANTRPPAERGGAPPAEVVAGWDREVQAEGPVRECDPAASRWLFGIDACPSAVHVPLRIGGAASGLLVLCSSAEGAFDEVPDEPFAGTGALAASALQTAELVEALEESNARRERVAQELVRQASASMAGVLLGDSPRVRGLRAEVARVAEVDPAERVLLVGPTGSGREAVARAIHAESPRSGRPFIPVTCVMVRGPEELAEKLELARGGTLYLHLIEQLAPDAGQRLRVALDGPGGEERDVRLIASCGVGSELPRDVEAWHSDERIEVPALVERKADIGAMSALFLGLNATRFGRGDLQLSPPSLARLEAYAWPANVRELMTVLEHAALTARGSVVEVDEALLESGQSVGSYTLLERLGAGGMGDVWRARHKHLTRPAAVKLIQGSAVGALDAAAVHRFRREAEATARLRSPHTVELYDFGLTAEGGFYYVMELLEGLDLQQLVERHGPLPPERAVHLLEQVLRSLMEAHGEGLVHRDVKPANLFVSRLGADYDFVKVLDFGLVTPVYDDEEAISESGVVGTPAYMSPEHASGEDLDGRSDLYSLGAVAFWMLTGERLFKVQNPAALVIAQMSQAPDVPSGRLGRPLPEGLDAWVLSLLAKSRTERPPTAREAYRRLSAIELPAAWTHERAEAWWREVAGWPVTPATGLPRTRSLKMPPR